MSKIRYNERMATAQGSLQSEERLVAELAQLGVNYLSRRNTGTARIRSPQIFLAELVCQPSSRVRQALIPLLLAHPEYAEHIGAALDRLSPQEVPTLKLFYTAAVILQQKHAAVLKKYLGAAWQLLPDLFSAELGVRGASPSARLKAVARLQAQSTGMQLNWAGTYENAALHLLRRWEVEQSWSQ